MPSDEEIEMAMGVIADKKPDLIGFGFMSSLYPIVTKVNARVRERFKDIPIVWEYTHFCARRLYR